MQDVFEDESFLVLAQVGVATQYQLFAKSLLFCCITLFHQFIVYSYIYLIVELNMITYFPFSG